VSEPRPDARLVADLERVPPKAKREAAERIAWLRSRAQEGDAYLVRVGRRGKLEVITFRTHEEE
jgi:hypothetical protein